MDWIIDNACMLWGVSREEVLGKSRRLPLPLVRAMIAKTLRSVYGLTLTNIGYILNRNHPTIVHYLKIFDSEYKYNKDFRNFANAMNDITQEIKHELHEELEDEYNEIYG